ncbi:hypothetical protein BDR06DRAFT_984070 [Suillus hirtellus]|nr:hypothetical protein BDR06DRAFT_984070 [Suillus hirtellus]
MKRLVAHDFEDILQCAIPVFEGLFPPNHDLVVQSLLYRFTQWHTLTKLRIHSDSTLKLSQKLWRFRDHTCAAFTTTELPKEKAACQKRSAQCPEAHNPPPESSRARVKNFNLNTYKFHAMGDYVRTIRFFGTTDSFTTQIVSIS